MTIRLSQVNKALAKRGVKEELVKGEGYFYFTGGEAHTWQETMVYAYSLNQLTLEQYLAEWERLSGKKFPEHR